MWVMVVAPTTVEIMRFYLNTPILNCTTVYKEVRKDFLDKF